MTFSLEEAAAIALAIASIDIVDARTGATAAVDDKRRPLPSAYDDPLSGDRPHTWKDAARREALMIDGVD